MVVLGNTVLDTVVQDWLRPHERLTFQLPVGFGMDRGLLLLQEGGASSTELLRCVCVWVCMPMCMCL